MKQKQKIHIRVVEARTLLPSDINGWSDPFCIVKIQNSNDKVKKIYKTKYINRTLNPMWDEQFSVNYDEKEDAFQSKLLFEIYDHDTMSANDILGKCEIMLGPYSDHKWIEKWYKLRLFNKDNMPLKCRGYLRLKIQILNYDDESSFLESDCSDQTNIHETRNDLFQQQQLQMDAVNQHYQVQSAQAHKQLQQNVTYQNEVTSQAQQMIDHKNQNPDQPMVAQAAVPVAPMNPQFANIPGGYQYPQGYPTQQQQYAQYPQQPGYPPQQQIYPPQQPGYPPQQPGYPPQQQIYPPQQPGYPPQQYQQPPPS